MTGRKIPKTEGKVACYPTYLLVHTHEFYHGSFCLLFLLNMSDPNFTQNSASMADGSYESVICVKNEVFVYKIPPRPSNRGYR